MTDDPRHQYKAHVDAGIIAADDGDWERATQAAWKALQVAKRQAPDEEEIDA